MEILLIGPSGPSIEGFLNGTFRAREVTPSLSHEIDLLSGGRSTDRPEAITGELSPLR
jgi:hypothetical protein